MKKYLSTCYHLVFDYWIGVGGGVVVVAVAVAAGQDHLACGPHPTYCGVKNEYVIRYEDVKSLEIEYQ